MTTFSSGLLWGSGLSLGICVGLVAWIFLREAANWLLGITAKLDRHLDSTLRSMALLAERNEMTRETNEQATRIALMSELLCDRLIHGSRD